MSGEAHARGAGLPLRVILSLGVAGAAMTSDLGAAALQQPRAKSHRISLAELRGAPGARLMMPLALSPDGRNPLRSFTLDIQFVSNNLLFEKAAPGMAAEMAEARIESTLSAREPDERGLKWARLRVKVSLPETEAQEGLPEGLLAFLYFSISPEAKPVRIRLTPTLVSARRLSTPEQEKMEVAFDPGLVEVTGDIEPIIGCFFYMH